MIAIQIWKNQIVVSDTVNSLTTKAKDNLILINIVATVKKKSADGKTFDSKNMRLINLGGGIASSIVTKQPCLDKDGSQVVIVYEHSSNSKTRR